MAQEYLQPNPGMYDRLFAGQNPFEQTSPKHNLWESFSRHRKTVFALSSLVLATAVGSNLKPAHQGALEVRPDHKANPTSTTGKKEANSVKFGSLRFSVNSNFDSLRKRAPIGKGPGVPPTPLQAPEGPATPLVAPAAPSTPESTNTAVELPSSTATTQATVEAAPTQIVAENDPNKCIADPNGLSAETRIPNNPNQAHLLPDNVYRAPLTVGEAHQQISSIDNVPVRASLAAYGVNPDDPNLKIVKIGNYLSCGVVQANMAESHGKHGLAAPVLAQAGNIDAQNIHIKMSGLINGQLNLAVDWTLTDTRKTTYTGSKNDLNVYDTIIVVEDSQGHTAICRVDCLNASPAQANETFHVKMVNRVIEQYNKTVTKTEKLMGHFSLSGSANIDVQAIFSRIKRHFPTIVPATATASATSSETAISSPTPVPETNTPIALQAQTQPAAVSLATNTPGPENQKTARPAVSSTSTETSTASATASASATPEKTPTPSVTATAIKEKLTATATAAKRTATAKATETASSTATSIKEKLTATATTLKKTATAILTATFTPKPHPTETGTPVPPTPTVENTPTQEEETSTAVPASPTARSIPTPVFSPSATAVLRQVVIVPPNTPTAENTPVPPTPTRPAPTATRVNTATAVTVNTSTSVPTVAPTFTVVEVTPTIRPQVTPLATNTQETITSPTNTAQPTAERHDTATSVTVASTPTPAFTVVEVTPTIRPQVTPLATNTQETITSPTNTAQPTAERHDTATALPVSTTSTIGATTVTVSTVPPAPTIAP